MKRKWAMVMAGVLVLMSMLSGAALAEQKTNLLVAAAASLEKVYTEELIPMFEAANPTIHVEGTYDSSGKLQTQIEEGLEADLFMSAAMKQMNALVEQALVEEASVTPLLVNRIVLIAPVDSATAIDSFARIAEAGTIALGDPQSVPAGQYAQEALTSLGVWEQALAKASLGTNVTEVLNWVAEGSAEVGIVYATDAASSDQVKILCEAPEGSLKQQVIYPVGIVASSQKKEAAQLFLDFLKSDGALAVFESYGFVRNP
jgi:molybdate transport system substrate-binding protein